MGRLVVATLTATTVLVVGSSAALGHGGEVDVVVEAKASDPFEVLHTDYAVMLTFADGDRVEDAAVSAKATDGTDTVLPIDVGAEGNVYILHFLYAQPGQWTLDLTVEHPDVQVELTLVEAIPVGNPGSHVVRLDTADQTRAGTVGSLAIPEHPLAAPPAPTTTTTDSPPLTSNAAANPPATSTSTLPTTTTVGGSASSSAASAGTSHRAAVQVTTRGTVSLPVELVARWAHLGMITVWGLAVLAIAVRLNHWLLPVASLAGLVGTLVTGSLLGLWGTPVGFPGIFRWSDIGALEYGSAWQYSFLIKMGGVIVAIVGTAMAAKRQRWRGAQLAVAGMGVALIAVTALSQFHLRTHG